MLHASREKKTHLLPIRDFSGVRAVPAMPPELAIRQKSGRSRKGSGLLTSRRLDQKRNKIRNEERNLEGFGRKYRVLRGDELDDKTE